MKFYYSEDGEYMLAQPADGRFYPFPVFAKDRITPDVFEHIEFGGFDTYAEAQQSAIAAGTAFADNPDIEIYSGDTK